MSDKPRDSETSGEKPKATGITAFEPNKQQFGTGLQYQSGRRWSRRTIGIAWGLLIAALILPYVVGMPKKKALKSDFVIIDASGNVIDLKLGSYIDVLTDADLAGSRKVRKKIIIQKYDGPQSIKRPNLNKVTPGSIAEAVLLSSGTNGPIRAKLIKAVMFNGEELVPEGAMLLGTGQSTESRLIVQFSRMVLPDGGVESIQAQAADKKDKSIGLRGKTIGKHAMRLGAAVGLNFVAGVSEGLQEKEVQDGKAINKPTTKNALLNGAKSASLELSRETMEKMKNEPIRVEVKAGTKFFVIFL